MIDSVQTAERRYYGDPNEETARLRQWAYDDLVAFVEQLLREQLERSHAVHVSDMKEAMSALTKAMEVIAEHDKTIEMWKSTAEKAAEGWANTHKGRW